jgi:hypothetical protein
MAEVLGVASSVAQLLEGAIRLLKRVRKAYERHQNLTAVLDKHALEIETINTLVFTIKNENALQTAVVIAELDKLYAVGVKLVRCLEELDSGKKGIVRQLAHQLVHGTKDEETLADIMRDLDRAKADLSLRVQLANVGLTRIVHDTVLANFEVINRMDRLLAGVFRKNHGLKLAGLLKDMDIQDDNLVPLSKADIAFLGRDITGETGSDGALRDGTMDRIIVGNTARDSAVQLLGPVGKDLWEDVRVSIENNTASGHATQIVYPTDFVTFKYLLDHQEKMAALETRWS